MLITQSCLQLIYFQPNRCLVAHFLSESSLRASLVSLIKNNTMQAVPNITAKKVVKSIPSRNAYRGPNTRNTVNPAIAANSPLIRRQNSHSSCLSQNQPSFLNSITIHPKKPIATIFLHSQSFRPQDSSSHRECL